LPVSAAAALYAVREPRPGVQQLIGAPAVPL
jgi:hypothetical protein